MRTSISTAAVRCVFALGLAFTLPAHANEIVNGDFETGDLSGWTQFGDGSYTGVDSQSPHAGAYAAYFGAPTSTTGGIAQTVPTVPGGVYLVDFWLSNVPDVLGVSTPNSFVFSWGGVPVLALSDQTLGSYAHYSFAEVATSASTAVAFAFGNDPSFWNLDDVAVAVPEPATSPMLLAGLLAGATALRARGRRQGR